MGWVVDGPWIMTLDGFNTISLLYMIFFLIPTPTQPNLVAVRKHPTLCVHVIVIGRFAIRIGFAAECLESSRFFPKSFWFGKQIIIQFSSVETDQRDKTQGQPAHGKKIALEKKKKKKKI